MTASARGLVAFTLLGYILSLVGCQHAEKLPPGGTTAVLVDRTLSVASKRLAEYPGYFDENVLGSLRPGERILVESISDKATLSDPPFRAVDTHLPDVTAPEYELRDDTLRYKKRCQEQVAKAAHDFMVSKELVKKQSAPIFDPTRLAQKSFIIDGIEDAADFLNHGDGPRVLVIFTDGIEDSEEYSEVIKFDEPRYWRGHSVEKLLSDLRGENRIPNLKGVHVYFVGAAAESAESYRSNSKFWAAFFRAAGVGDNDMHYGHLPSWFEPVHKKESDEVKELMKNLCPAQ